MFSVVCSFLPVIGLIYLMTRKRSLPAYKALPLTAFAMYLISLFVFQRDVTEVHATVLHGLLTALTPISIIWGAVLLFKTMEATGAMPRIQSWLNSVSLNNIAQLMIVGWTFTFLIEGASGFGTPAALAAPVLVGLGFPPIRVAIMILIMDTVPVTFGAVGTPTWFGFSGVQGLTAAQVTEIGVKSALIHGAAALIIPLIALRFISDIDSIKRNLGFIYISVLSTVIPYVTVAFFSYEFPSLVGGFVGLIVSVFAAQRGWGLSQAGCTVSDQGSGADEQIGLLKASFPLWGTLLLLVVTRVQQLGIKPLLIGGDSLLELECGGLGTFGVTSGLVLSLKAILGTTIAWDYKLLYVPALVPFGIISAVSFIVFRSDRAQVLAVTRQSIVQLKWPSITLFGALVFVGLMMMGGETAAVAHIGRVLADLCGESWQIFAAYLGAVGSFFSGSNTISNLTFGGIQDSIAVSLGLSRTTILALQSVGGAMGNMVCINAVVAVCSVLSLHNREGEILKKMIVPMIVYGVIAAVMSYLV